MTIDYDDDDYDYDYGYDDASDSRLAKRATLHANIALGVASQTRLLCLPDSLAHIVSMYTITLYLPPPMLQPPHPHPRLHLGTEAPAMALSTIDFAFHSVTACLSVCLCRHTSNFILTSIAFLQQTAILGGAQPGFECAFAPIRIP